MKSLLLVAVLVGVVLGLAWLTYPTSVASELKVFKLLSDSDFYLLRRDAILFARENSAKGVVINAGDEASTSFGLSCKGVPLLLVDNSYVLMTVNVMDGADHRVPGLDRFLMDMYSKLEPSGRPGPSAPSEGGALEYFMLKYRDGIDLSQQCR